MRMLAESVRARYLQQLGIEAALPEDGYQGEYIRDIAHDLVERDGNRLIDNAPQEPFKMPPRSRFSPTSAIPASGCRSISTSIPTS